MEFQGRADRIWRFRRQAKHARLDMVTVCMKSHVEFPTLEPHGGRKRTQYGRKATRRRSASTVCCTSCAVQEATSRASI